MQNQLNNKDEEYEEINPQDDDSEILKLKENDEIKGLLLDTYQSTKYPGTPIYKIQDKEGKRYVILATTVLEHKMKTIEIGDEISILRVKDATSKTGTPYQDYKVYRKKKP